MRFSLLSGMPRVPVVRPLNRYCRSTSLRYHLRIGIIDLNNNTRSNFIHKGESDETFERHFFNFCCRSYFFDSLYSCPTLKITTNWLLIPPTRIQLKQWSKTSQQESMAPLKYTGLIYRVKKRPFLASRSR